MMDRDRVDADKLRAALYLSGVKPGTGRYIDVLGEHKAVFTFAEGSRKVQLAVRFKDMPSRDAWISDYAAGWRGGHGRA